MSDDDALTRLIDLLARLPGLGPRSARRAALYLIKRREAVLEPLARAMADVARSARPCGQCGAATTGMSCAICRDPRRDAGLLCVVEDTGDVWALERAGAFRGRYHVLGGALSALEGVGPDDLRIPQLMTRVAGGEVREVVLALNATVEGQTTAHYIADRLSELGVGATSLARGVPVGGELDYLDEGTLTAAFQARKPF